MASEDILREGGGGGGAFFMAFFFSLSLFFSFSRGAMYGCYVMDIML